LDVGAEKAGWSAYDDELQTDRQVLSDIG